MGRTGRNQGKPKYLLYLQRGEGGLLDPTQNWFDKNTLFERCVWKAIQDACSLSTFDFLILLLINITNEHKSNIHTQDDLAWSESGMNDITGECTWIHSGLGWKWMDPINIPTCKADWTFEGTSHSFKTVFYQMALKFGRRIKCLVAELAFMV